MTDQRRTCDVDPDAPPTEEELREAAAFAARLEPSSDAGEPSDLEALAQGIGLLHPSRAPSRADIEVASGRAVKHAVDRFAPQGARILTFPRAVAATSAMVAIAAGALFVLGSPMGYKSAVAPLALIESRSTQPLFTQPFSQQPASARIDRIATARMGDLRENHFRW